MVVHTKVFAIILFKIIISKHKRLVLNNDCPDGHLKLPLSCLGSLSSLVCSFTHN